jgi:ribose transport system permease protein
MTERNMPQDFKGFMGAALTLLMLVLPYVEGLSPNFVAAALVLRSNMALFLLAGWLALCASVFNLIWGARMQLPRFLYAVPFETLLLALLFWGAYSLSGLALPEHGIAKALQTMGNTVKASTDARILWALLSVGALIGLGGGIANLKEAAAGRYSGIMLLIVLFSISSEVDPHFLQTRSVLDLSTQISHTGIIALGMTFVIISGGVDLSVGSLSAFLGGIMIGVLNFCAASFGDGGTAVLCALLTGVVLGVLSGAVSGFMITKLRVAPFVATLGTMAIYRSLALYISNAGEFRSTSAFFSKAGAACDPVFGISYSGWTFLVLAVSGAVLLNWTRYGRYAAAVGSNEKAAVYAAIRVDKTRAFSYMLAGAATGIATFFLAARRGSVHSVNMGVNFEMDAIAAVVVGGTSMNGGSGTVAGTVVGAVILGLVNNMLNMTGVSPYLLGMVKGIVIVTAVTIQSKRRD